VADPSAARSDCGQLADLGDADAVARLRNRRIRLDFTDTGFVAVEEIVVRPDQGVDAHAGSIAGAHFDAAGQANAFMSRSGYTRFVLCLVLGLPLGVVAILTAVYSRATDLKLPNRDYWLAPQRIDRTRAFLVAHGVWFGSLLVALVCCVHWLELGANRLQPPHLSNQTFAVVLLAFLIATAVWIAAHLMRTAIASDAATLKIAPRCRHAC